MLNKSCYPIRFLFHCVSHFLTNELLFFLQQLSSKYGSRIHLGLDSLSSLKSFCCLRNVSSCDARTTFHMFNIWPRSSHIGDNLLKWRPWSPCIIANLILITYYTFILTSTSFSSWCPAPDTCASHKTDAGSAPACTSSGKKDLTPKWILLDYIYFYFHPFFLMPWLSHAMSATEFWTN